jgi:hypothetical protein
VYTDSLVEQLLWASQKGILGNNVMEYGTNEWNPKMNGLCKARQADWVLSDNLTTFYMNLGVGNYKQFPRTPAGDIQFETCIAKDFVDKGFDLPGLFAEVHNRTKVGGLLIINSPIGISSAMIALTPNAVSHLKRKNGYDVPYYRIETESRTFSVQLNSDIQWTTGALREKLYKFREVQDLRLSVIFKKNSDAEFTY